MDIFIDTPGTYVHVKDEMFEIRKKKDGQVEKHSFAAHKVRTIQMTRGIALSSDAVALALKHNVDMLFLASDGQPVGRVWHSKLGSTTKIRKEQLVASMNADGVMWVKNWLEKKLEAQIGFLKDLKKHRDGMRDFLDEKVSGIEKMKQSIMSAEADTLSEISESIRGWEGTAGRMYFEALSKIMPAPYGFEGRSRRPALDPFNAFLNYAYGMLYGTVEKSLIIAGLDPYLGFLHRDDYNQKSLVFDFIEPYRIYAERVVVRLFSGKKVNQSHTEKLTNGYSLGKEGKPVLVQAFQQYMLEEKIRHQGRNLSRSHAIQLDAHAFSNSLIK
ncbi:MAG: CRISPR-associated endonuclease Cas1 [Bacteroidia bacterium]